jgi:hypothetical protein
MRDKTDLIRYHTSDGTFVDMHISPTGVFVQYDVIKELVLQYISGIHQMAILPGSEGEAALHNECIRNIEALFEEKDPLDDEIKELENKLNELKELKANGKNKT